jgi:hypothetical protein
VGLRMNLELATVGVARDMTPAARPSQPLSPKIRQPDEPPAAPKPASRVRVFRSRPREDQSTG